VTQFGTGITFSGYTDPQAENQKVIAHTPLKQIDRMLETYGRKA